ncbi:ComEC/Rec2 family competence protein [Nocardioides caldifontis]|uniref:ComEC/Rec2 family competence protein n=1 Tax=Nocardioides caldifontis TaxID=2588938 RepID=UPI001EEF7E10|nr:ComEC/Rec2 family competence protein [Nocardioides caldifontis]
MTSPGPEPAAITPADLRTSVLAVAAWGGALAGLHVGGWWLVGALVTVTVSAAVALVAGAPRMVLATLLVAVVLAGSAGLRVAATAASPVARWAEDRTVVTGTATVRTDPVLREGQFGDYVVAEVRMKEATSRGETRATGATVLVLARPGFEQVRLGSVVRLTGRLAPADDARLAGVLSVGREPVLLAPPPKPLDAAEAVRASVRRAASDGPDDAAALVPALVTGDDAALDESVVEDFQDAGLTHLTAVSGTNLTLLLAFLLLLARWCRVRGRGLVVVGLVGVVGFVLIARTEPSVVRAAAMGTVALLGMGSGGRAAGVRSLGAAVLLLLLLDPWLAGSPGFALSALATGGILFVGPVLRDAMGGWLPRPVAEAVAVPLAAQLACTPVVAALSEEVSLVAVAANLVAAPAVGPATVLGLVGGVVGLLVPPVGALLGTVGCWSAQVIVLVARWSADLPTASTAWPAGPAGLSLLVVLTVTATLLAPRVLRSRRASSLVLVLLAAVVVRPLPAPGWWSGWPPDGWVVAMCDVGQGDAVVVAAGDGAAVLFDAGPDPPAVDRCLDRLGVRRLPAVVLTHFHADHVDGLPGVLAGRQVGEVQVTGLREPEAGAAQVERWAAAAQVPLRVPAYGERAGVGPVTWQVLAPRRVLSENPNDASLVLLVEAHGVRLLLTGDVEPGSQAALLREPVGRIDVLKVPHHGSAHQDARLLTGLGARVGLVSVGEDNDYGHPSGRTLELLEEAGVRTWRTDERGDVAVVLRGDELRVVTSR